MTKEQIEKHGKVIKWFVDNPDKGVWRKDTPTNDWYVDNTPNWYEDYIYVQNDKYAKFRKALVDGKELQYTEDNGKTWFTHYRKLDTWFNTKNIRIKPEEPEFKIGDWVKIKQNGKLIQLKGKKHCKPNAIYDEVYDNYFFMEDIELWKPQEGE